MPAGRRHQPLVVAASTRTARRRRRAASRTRRRRRAGRGRGARSAGARARRASRSPRPSSAVLHDAARRDRFGSAVPAPATASRRAAFSSVSCHSAAGSESAVMPPPTPSWVAGRRHGERADRDREVGPVPLGVDPADRAAVDAAPDRLEVLDRLQHARLGRAGDRRRAGTSRAAGRRARRRRATCRAPCSRGGRDRGAARARRARAPSPSPARTPGRGRCGRGRRSSRSRPGPSRSRAATRARRPVPLIGRVSTRRPSTRRKRSGDADTTATSTPGTSAPVRRNDACGAGLPVSSAHHSATGSAGRGAREPAGQVHLVAVAGLDEVDDRADAGLERGPVEARGPWTEPGPDLARDRTGARP